MVRDTNTRGGRGTCFREKSSGVEPMAGVTMMPSALYSAIFLMKSAWRSQDSLVLHRKTVRPAEASESSSDASKELKNGSEMLLRITPTV